MYIYVCWVRVNPDPGRRSLSLYIYISIPACTFFLGHPDPLRNVVPGYWPAPAIHIYLSVYLYIYPFVYIHVFAHVSWIDPSHPVTRCQASGPHALYLSIYLSIYLSFY